MVQFDNKRGTLPRLEMIGVPCWKQRGTVKSEPITGAAWLSSVRAVKCTVNSDNERNPYFKLQCLKELPRLTGRKVGMTSNQHGSYALGYTRATMASTKGCQAVTRS